MSRSVPGSGKKGRLVPRVKIWLEADGRYVFGHGLGEMLRAVKQAGSIKQAAARLGKSYRYVWGRIKQAEAVLGRAFVQTHVGGKGVQRSFLTPAGDRFLRDFSALRQKVIRLVEHEFARRLSHLGS